MLLAAEQILEFTRGITREQFFASPMRMHAVMHDFTILGEAACHVPDDVAEAHPEIEWAQIRAMRHVIVHEYFGADMNVVWATIQNDVTDVIPKLRAILQNER
jgi:uncharacterized protein with HEPN domain